MQMVEEQDGHSQATADENIIQRLGPDSYTGRLLVRYRPLIFGTLLLY